MFLLQGSNISMMSPFLSDPSVFLASCVKWNIVLVKVYFQLMGAVWNQFTETAPENAVTGKLRSFLHSPFTQ